MRVVHVVIYPLHVWVCKDECKYYFLYLIIFADKSISIITMPKMIISHLLVIEVQGQVEVCTMGFAAGDKQNLYIKDMKLMLLLVYIILYNTNSIHQVAEYLNFR